MTMNRRAVFSVWVVGVGLLVELFLASLCAQEIITLTTPESVPTVTGFRVARIIIEPNDPNTLADEGKLIIHLAGLGRQTVLSCEYHATTSPTGTVLITALNKTNLSTAYAGNATTGSLQQRVHHRLVVMGEAAQVCGRAITGSLSGTVP